MGKLIVIDGLDGSGKRTQTELLYNHLKDKIENIKRIEFPTYTKSSTLAEMYLNGEFGDNPDDVNVYASSVFYSVDRFASYTNHWGEFYRNGGLVVTDRYTTANVVHQMSKLSKDSWDDFIKWLFDLEFDRFGLPRPELVIFLDLPPEHAKLLLEKRYEGDNSKKDVHEKNMKYLARCYEAADYAVKKLGWVRICCSGPTGELYSIEEIQTKIISEVQKLILC